MPTILAPAVFWPTWWPLGHLLALYLLGECIFFYLFWKVFLPRCNRHSEPQEYRGYGKDRHKLNLRIFRRILRRCKASGTPLIPAFAAFLLEYFHADSGEVKVSPNGLPYKEDIDIFFSWAFFGLEHAHLQPWMESELYLMYEEMNRQFGIKFEAGGGGAKLMRLSLDHVEPNYRPLFVYLLFGWLQIVAKFVLAIAGFSVYTTKSGLRYWHRPAQADHEAPDSPLPTVFFHGIAPGGLFCYLPMLLFGLGRDGRSLFLFENPAICFQVCFRSPTEAETVHGITEAIKTHLKPDEGLSVVGHSFGSCQVTWLLHSQHAHRIRQVTLMDPVAILLSEPDVMTNFLYTRKAHKKQGGAPRLGAVANELFVEHYLRRQFAWYNSDLWLDDIPNHCETVIVLAENDVILNAKSIKREIELHKDEVESASNIEVLAFEGDGHAACVFRRDRWDSIRQVIRRQEQVIRKKEYLASNKQL